MEHWPWVRPLGTLVSATVSLLEGPNHKKPDKQAHSDVNCKGEKYSSYECCR
jgi:hypothetical protein